MAGAENARKPSRREARRQETIDEIKTLARRQLADHGAGGLSLRAIARDMRMTSAAIYRYFDNQSCLIGALCVDAYTSLGDAIAAARRGCSSEPPARKWWVTSWAIRRWASDNQAEFALIFGTPIAGYHAPAEVTGPAASRAAAMVLDTYAEALAAGVIDLDQRDVPDRPQTGPLGDFLNASQANSHSAETIAVVLNAWASILGFLVSESFGNLPLLWADTDALYAAHTRSVMRAMGYSAVDRAECVCPRA